MKTLILTPIAERDVHFYLDTADQLKKKGALNIVFISFFQPGNDLIRGRGYPVYDPYPAMKRSELLPLPTEEIQMKFRTPSIESLSQHEFLTFGLSHLQQALDKWSRMFPAVDHLLSQIEKDFEAPEQNRIIVQELAGFIGPLCLFYVGMNRKWTHYFTEPAFFKGRIHFLKNSLFFKVRPSPSSALTQQQVTKYLEGAFTNKIVVAAVKDAHHYRDMGLTKVFNSQNFQKLGKKLINKYIRNQEYEFDHLWNHSRRYLKMLFNRWRNRNSYCSLDSLPEKNIFYFPFHVQLDFSLTIRSPRWLDQLTLIEEILKNLPANSLLVAKEHPASIGCLDQKHLEKLLQDDRFRILHPLVNSYDIFTRCKAVITINSKVGAEALSRGLPTFTFGKAFYTEEGFSTHFSNWADFKNSLEKTLSGSANFDRSAWFEFLARTWEQSFAAELYDLRKDNISDFTNALKKVLTEPSL